MEYDLEAIKKKYMKIEKGIEINNEYINKNFPFHKMEAGDSFFLSENELGLTRIKSRAKLASQAHLFGKKTKKKFIVRSVENGFRCWRIA